MRKLIDGAIILAILTAFFYAVSSAYRNGYLHSIELNENILDIDFHHGIYQGFVLAFTGLMPILSIAIIYIGFISISIFAIFSIAYLTSKKLRTAIRRWRSSQNWRKLFPASASNAENLMSRLFKVTCIAFLPLAFLLILLAYFEQKGKTDAAADLKDATQEIPVRTKKVTISLDGKSTTLVLLVCGVRNCSGYEQKSQEIYYFPQQTMHFKAKQYK